MANLHQRCVPNVQRLARHIRQGIVIIIHALVTELKCEFPSEADSELTRTLDEEVILAHRNAVWYRGER
jgi:hypothetical protein